MALAWWDTFSEAVRDATWVEFETAFREQEQSEVPLPYSDPLSPNSYYFVVLFSIPTYEYLLTGSLLSTLSKSPSDSNFSFR